MAKQNDRGSILVEDLPTVLESAGEDLLHLKIEHKGKVIESNLYDEILLGSDRFDPFHVMNMVDKVAALVAFWSTVLGEIREQIEGNQNELNVVEANIRKFLHDKILSERPKGIKKSPSVAEIEGEKSRLFDENSQENNDKIVKGLDEKKGSNIIFNKNLYLGLRERLKELKSKEMKVEIARDAWKDKAYLLRTHADLLITLINHNLIKLPEERNVYENW